MVLANSAQDTKSNYDKQPGTPSIYSDIARHILQKLSHATIISGTGKTYDPWESRMDEH